MIEKIKNLWRGFEEKYPKASQWVREGGLFVIVSNVITVFKYLLLTFLPAACFSIIHAASSAKFSGNRSK